MPGLGNKRVDVRDRRIGWTAVCRYIFAITGLIHDGKRCSDSCEEGCKETRQGGRRGTDKPGKMFASVSYIAIVDTFNRIYNQNLDNSALQPLNLQSGVYALLQKSLKLL